LFLYYDEKKLLEAKVIIPVEEGAATETDALLLVSAALVGFNLGNFLIPFDALDGFITF